MRRLDRVLRDLIEFEMVVVGTDGYQFLRISIVGEEKLNMAVHNEPSLSTEAENTSPHSEKRGDDTDETKSDGLECIHLYQKMKHGRAYG